MKNIKKIIMVIIGTLIGAGFASGREIYLFFFKFGKMGLVGIVLSSIITGLIIYLTLKIVDKREIDNYDEFINTINIKNKNINNFIKGIVTIFLLISFFIMVAGFSAYIKQSYNIPNYISSGFFVIIIYMSLRKNIQGMLKINTVLVPIILILIFFLGIKNFNFILQRPEIIAQENSNYWFIYSLFYSSYNSIILIPVVISLRKYILNKEEIKYISVISVMLIIILSLCIFGLLLKGENYIREIEMPLLRITAEYGYIIQKMYGIVIVISIFTSAISVGYSFLENISNKKSFNRNLVIMCLSSIFISNIGFSTLVQILYPVFGVFGILQLFFICKMSLKN